LGANGLTAYAGLLRVAALREGDDVWVSAAAGSVGSVVAQLAKLRGHRVVGSAGSPAKVSYLLDEFGLDAAFDYHAGPVGELLREATPDGIDVYFDNVGGEHLEAAIGALRRGGGSRSAARSRVRRRRPPPGPSNMFLLVAKDLSAGFVIESRRPARRDAARARRTTPGRPPALAGDGGRGLDSAPSPSRR
jgi:NADPH-dependent curcumin reductase CurA